MKVKFFIVVAFLALVFSACDDTTDTIGNSLTDGMDRLNISTGIFPVQTTSHKSGAVLSRNTVGYLGKIRDNETGSYVTGDFMAQFATLENYSLLPYDSISSYVISTDENGNEVKEVIADSCVIELFYDDFWGDSLATMKLTAYEMAKPMEEGVKYYSDFDPIKEGYIRSSSENGIKVAKVYTLSDQTVDNDTRNDDSYMPSIKISLNKPYTDKNGKTYNNYGTYLMRKYYENPDNFRNSYNFIHNVCPGFYFKLDDGLGSMAYVNISRLSLFFRSKVWYTEKDETTNEEVRKVKDVVYSSSFLGTEEVLQTTNITNDNQAIDRLVADESCTYLKTPAGIFTEMTLPVDDIMKGHENDTINIAKVTLTRFNNNGYDNKYELSTPSTLLMIPLDSLETFFGKEKIMDNRTSFVTSESKKKNTYTFNNISGMITYMAGLKRAQSGNNPNWVNEHPNWNKVVIVPVTVTTNGTNDQIVKIVHDMSITSARFVKGKGDGDDNPVQISVIYSKFNDKR
ncbi:MAG: DUF4270 domain-containing protein [Prevotella sp.]|nr:DUF4270 domain-containing protein [Prevotella sp.]MBS5529102.1 DUF4270 domain-containing protein [Prevotella sp.]